MISFVLIDSIIGGGVSRETRGDGTGYGARLTCDESAPVAASNSMTGRARRKFMHCVL